MYCTSMLPPSGRLLPLLFILCTNFLLVRTSAFLSTKFNITLKTPSNTSSLISTTVPYKSVHVKYAGPQNDDNWTIVRFEPLIQRHYKAVQQLTVHLCDLPIYKSIWFDDETGCNSARSVLIYEWTPYSSSTPFHLPDNCGFELSKYKSIVLTTVYRKEKRIHKEQSGIILHMSTQSPKFQMGTIFVGNKQRSTRFSCRSSNLPRLLYAVKKLYGNENNIWWRIHIIRVRQFRRNIIQSVLDSSTVSNVNKSEIEIVSSDVFLMKDDYLLIECEDIPEANCYFLIYYNYKSIKNENICQNNDYPHLFKILPPREIPEKNHNTTNISSVDGSTIFLSIFTVLFAIWISTIIGCVIMRRIRGLVNYRTEPVSPLSHQKNRLMGNAGRSHDQCQHRTGDADHIMQMDGEHAGP